MQARFQLALDAIALLVAKATFIGLRLLFLYLSASSIDRAEFGALALAFTTAEICRYIGDWGTDNWSLRMFSHPNWKFAASHFLWVLRLRLIGSVFAFLLAWFLISIFAPQPSILRHAGIALTAATSLWLNLGINWLQARGALKPAVLLTAILGISCTFLLILGHINKIAVDQQLLSLIATEIIMTVSVLFVVRRNISEYGKWVYVLPVRVKEWWKSVTPIALAALLALAYGRVDQYYVNQTSSLAVLGDYSLAQRIVEPIIFVMSAFASTIYVRASAFVHTHGIGSRTSKYAWRWVFLTSLLVTIVCVALGIFFKLAILPYLSIYQSILPYIWFALICTAFRCTNLCLTAFIQAMGAYNYMLRINIINAITISIGVVLFGFSHGPVGAALGVCVGEALNTCMQCFGLKILLKKRLVK